MSQAVVFNGHVGSAPSVSSMPPADNDLNHWESVEETYLSLLLLTCYHQFTPETSAVTVLPFIAFIFPCCIVVRQRSKFLFERQ